MSSKAKRNLRAGAGAARMVEDIIGCKWSLTVLGLVADGVHRPGAMQRRVSGLTAKVLNEHTSIKLEIQGHTDDVGKRETNMTLSQARADAVRDYLVKKGVDAARLRSVGYGPDKPVDPAKTKAARDKNRRVEFVIITQ